MANEVTILLTTLKVVDAIEFDKLATAIVDKSTAKEIEDLSSWEHKDYMCRNYILNCLTLDLYDVYWSCKSAKELWNSLEKKYNVGTKKYVVGKFLDFKMDDIKTVVVKLKIIY